MATVPTPKNDQITGTAADDVIDALAGNDVVRAGDGADDVRGNRGNDKLFGDEGDDRLAGDQGNDDIDGGDGLDTAVYTGSSEQYQITTDADGVTTVKDLRGGRPDGIDQLSGVERLAFADQVLSLVPNRPPGALDDQATTREDTAVAIDVLANDANPDGDALAISVGGDPQAPEVLTAGGAAVSVVGGQIRYDPSASAQLNAPGPGEFFDDVFTYTVSDGFGGTDTAEVAVRVEGVNDAPVAGSREADTREDYAIVFNVLYVASDPEGDPLSLTGLIDADTGTPGIQSTLGATISLYGSQVLYDPTTSARLDALPWGSEATDTFEYQVSDPYGASSVGLVSVTVSGQDEPL